MNTYDKLLRGKNGHTIRPLALDVRDASLAAADYAAILEMRAGSEDDTSQWTYQDKLTPLEIERAEQDLNAGPLVESQHLRAYLATALEKLDSAKLPEDEGFIKEAAMAVSLYDHQRANNFGMTPEQGLREHLRSLIPFAEQGRVIEPRFAGTYGSPHARQFYNALQAINQPVDNAIQYLEHHHIATVDPACGITPMTHVTLWANDSEEMQAFRDEQPKYYRPQNEAPATLTLYSNGETVDVGNGPDTVAQELLFGRPHEQTLTPEEDTLQQLKDRGAVEYVGPDGEHPDVTDDEEPLFEISLGQIEHILGIPSAKED